MFGFKYNFGFDTKSNDDDIIFGKAIIDKSSLDIISGSVVDFKKEMIGETFVIDNPKATASWLWSLFFYLMKIISWNVNSVRARIENIKNYIKILLLIYYYYRKLKHQLKIFQMMNLKN